MLSWYTLYTKPNAEVQVARTLRARGLEVFLPLLPARPAERAHPLFPTYLFVHCDLAEVGIDTLQWVPGLRRILSFGGRLAVVSETAIQMIEAGLNEIQATGRVSQHRFKPGDAVIIDSGPLTGLLGVFQGPVGPAERVRILIRFLGETNKADVPVGTLRRASEYEARRRGTRGRGRRIRYVDETRSEEITTP